jgi:hypothetical protein
MTLEVLNELDVYITALGGVADLAAGKDKLDRVSTLIEVLTEKMEEKSEALRKAVATA